MNYIKIINNFWNVEIERQFTPIETRLYFLLLKYANRLRWKRKVRVPNSKLTKEIGCSKSAFLNARENLIKFDLIWYTKGNPNQCGSYTIVENPKSLIDLPEDKLEANYEESSNNPINNEKELPDEDNENTTYDTTEKTTCNTNEETTYGTDPQNIYKTKLNEGETIEDISLENPNELSPHRIIELYNSICQDHLPSIGFLEGKRLKDLKKRIKEFPVYETWAVILNKVIASDYLTGRSGKWKANFDWIIRDKMNIIKILEGNYDNLEKKKDSNSEWELDKETFNELHKQFFGNKSF